MKEYRIRCMEGELAGSEIMIQPGEQIVVGREPRFVNLVFRDMTISRKHCMIELDDNGEYYVTDYSESGLMTGEGKLFEKFVRTHCQRRCILIIGKACTKIMLG